MGDDDGWGQEHRRQSQQPLAAVIHTRGEELFHIHINTQVSHYLFLHVHTISLTPLSILLLPISTLYISYYMFLLLSVLSFAVLDSSQKKKKIKNLILTCCSMMVNSTAEV